MGQTVKQDRRGASLRSLSRWPRRRRRPSIRRHAVPIFLFDLDNTLFDADRHCFPWMHEHINAYLMTHLQMDRSAADALRRDYWQRYGSTLAGLLRHHTVDPCAYLEAIHPPVLSRSVPADPALGRMLAALPGPAYVFTNSVASHAQRVLERLGVAHQVSAIFDVAACGFTGKPQLGAYRAVLRSLGVPAARCWMFEDTLANLRSARQLGMHTVYVGRLGRRAHSAQRKLRSLTSWGRRG